MEMPTLDKMAAHSTSYGGGDLLMGQVGLGVPMTHADNRDLQRIARDFAAGQAVLGGINHGATNINQVIKEKYMARIVRVFIVDPNENIPLDKRVIHKSDEKLTDATDQELFFEVDPAGMLRAHNEYRTTVLDKALTKATGKETLLEPARIRDLRMIVVDVVKF